MRARRIVLQCSHGARHGAFVEARLRRVRGAVCWNDGAMKQTVVRALLMGVFAASPLVACSGGASSPGAAGTDASAGATGAAGTTSAAGTAGDAGATGGAATGAATDAGVVNVAGTAGATGVAGAGGAAAGASGAAAGASGAAGASSPVDGGADAGSTIVPFPSTQTVKMMVVGSSNEIGTCWRAYLWQELHTNDITNFDFVGQQSGGPSCTVVGWNDTQLQAMSGIIITNITTSTYLSWFMANPPDVILMHFGGADLLSGMPIDGVMKSFGRALDAARMVNPKVVLVIAQHTPEGKDTVPTLNADIAAWAPTVNTAESPVRVVDLYTGMLPSDFSDGVHLNQQGAMKVADRWYAALVPFFKP